VRKPSTWFWRFSTSAGTGPLVRAGGRSAEFLYRRGRRTDALTIGIEHPAPKPRWNRIREERIHNEIIVDAYGPEEQARSWYYYLENKIQFPFTARCIVSKVVSPLRKGETVEVPGLAPEDSCAHYMLVSIRWHGRHVAAPLSQLTAIDADESTVEAIGDWHYWLAQGYCF
jgi:Calcium binding